MQRGRQVRNIQTLPILAIEVDCKRKKSDHRRCARHNGRVREDPGRQQPCWGSLFCTNLTQPTSALDVASQDMTIETLLALRKKTDLSILLVTHNMEVARRLADEIGVMYQGRIIESGLPEEIWNDPKEDYTKKLIAAIPQPVKLVLDEG